VTIVLDIPEGNLRSCIWRLKLWLAIRRSFQGKKRGAEKQTIRKKCPGKLLEVIAADPRSVSFDCEWEGRNWSNQK
jgi:hypothetical protein